MQKNKTVKVSPVTFSANAAVAKTFSQQDPSTTLVSATAKAVDQVFTDTQQKLEQLALKRESWEFGVYRTAKIELYTLLAECYDFYKSMEGNTDAAKAKRKALVDCCNVRGFSFRDSTHSINRIVACVFGVDRRRVSAYATAMREAIRQGIEPNALVDYLINAGGIEEVRANKTGKALASKDKAALAAKDINAEKLGTVKGTELAQKLDAGKIGAHTVLLGTWNADGSIDVRAVVNSASVLKSALACHYTAEKAKREKAAAEAEQQTIEAIKLDAIQAAAAEVLG